MPVYDFTCSCGKTDVVICKYEDLKEPICSCGKNMSRNYTSKLKMNNTRGKNDPTSHNYWKKGKSVNDIADILSTNESPY